jgi:hypothetical protein
MESCLSMQQYQRALNVTVFALAAMTLLVPAQCQSKAQTATEPFGMEIESLLKTELDADDDSAQIARVQELFAEYGIPSQETLDRQTAMDFVVLLAQDQPLSFVQKVAPAIGTAVRQGLLPENSQVFFEAVIRQREVTAKVGAPTMPQLKMEIEALLEKDQAVRQTAGFDVNKMKQTDEEDREKVRAILERNGVPTVAMVGSEAASDFVVLIQHQSSDFRREALPKLKANVDTGQASPKDYAMMYDRAQTDEGRPETYGVNLICEPDGTFAPGSLIDPAHVEDRRAAIGLMPLATYVRMAAALMPPDLCKATQNPPAK